MFRRILQEYLLQHGVASQQEADNLSILFRLIVSPVPNAMQILDTAIIATSISMATFVNSTARWFLLDHIFHDISPLEEARSLLILPKQDLSIDTLTDLKAESLTRFNKAKLRRIYNCIGLEDYMRARNEDYILIPTGQVNQKGFPVKLRYDPEELFLFWIIKIAQGLHNKAMCDIIFGGSTYSKWSLGFPWMVKYVDDRYQNVIGPQDLAHSLPNFDRYAKAIKDFMKKTKVHVRADGSSWISPGIRFNPFQNFSWIDANARR